MCLVRSSCNSDISCSVRVFYKYFAMSLTNLEAELANATCSIPQLKTDLLANANDFDATDLAALLQCMGFNIEKFEKPADVLDNTKESTFEDGSLRVEITCNKSGMKATLSTEIYCCKCPSYEAASNAQYWNISGCGPSNQGNISVSKSNILPTISPADTSVIKLMLLRALRIINGIDINRNVENCFETTKNSLKRPRSLEVLKSDASTSSSRSSSRQNWEHVPATSPPKDTSSPIPNGCKRRDEVDKSAKLINSLTGMKKMLDEAIELASGQNTTFTKGNRTRKISSIKISPLVVEDTNKPMTGSFVNMSCAKTPELSLNKKTPLRGIPKKILAVSSGKGRFLAQASKFGYRSPSTETSLPPKKDTPRSSLLKDKNAKPASVSKATPDLRRNSAGTTKLRLPSKINISNAAKKL